MKSLNRLMKKFKLLRLKKNYNNKLRENLHKEVEHCLAIINYLVDLSKNPSIYHHKAYRN